MVVGTSFHFAMVGWTALEPEGLQPFRLICLMSNRCVFYKITPSLICLCPQVHLCPLCDTLSRNSMEGVVSNRLARLSVRSILVEFDSPAKSSGLVDVVEVDTGNNPYACPDSRRSK